ncbi:MAG TPA: ATP synthase F1 subunit delta [Roseiflexaceae bacterium]|nr:ATP synthase F1 subunit delta [Roseiflexaceae bacterium]
MTTSDARDAARALYDALMSGVLQSLKTAAPRLQNVSLDGPEAQSRIAAALPADTPPLVGRFLVGLANAGKLDQISSVVRELEKLAQAGGAATLDAEVTSAVELSDAQRERIISDLRNRYGEGLQVAFRTDASLIGGLIIRVGDQVLDNSLRTRLGAIQRNMTAS